MREPPPGCVADYRNTPLKEYWRLAAEQHVAHRLVMRAARLDLLAERVHVAKAALEGTAGKDSVDAAGLVDDICRLDRGMDGVRAAEALLGIAVPRQSGLVDDEGNTQLGVVLLPPLGGSNGDRSHGVVEEEIGLEVEAKSEDRDEAPGPIEAVVPAALAKHVLANRLARRIAGNGHPKGSHS